MAMERHGTFDLGLLIPRPGRPAPAATIATWLGLKG
jgi:hypothetical protein